MRLAEHMRQEVASTFFLLRAIGYATFVFQGNAVQVALALDDLPAGALEHSERVAITLLVAGGLILATLPFVRRRGRYRPR